MNAVVKKVLFQRACFKLAAGFIYFLFESSGGVGTKDKPLVRTENSSIVKVWLERLWIMFLLSWKVYDTMVVAVNFVMRICIGFVGRGL